MIKKLKAEKNSTLLFIVAAIATFIILSFGYFLIKIVFYQPSSNKPQSVNERYYLNKDFEQSDPYLTKIPDLGDMLVGPIISSVDPSLGSPQAPVVIVEFSDYLCNYCKQQEQVIKKTLNEYKDKLRLVWKDYPERKQDSPSFKAAIAARCAGEQGAYWPYHDLLFNLEENIEEDVLMKLANSLRLNLDQFKPCLSSDKVINNISDNVEEANALNINGIPFMYINDQEILGQASYEELKRIIEIELDKLE